MADPSTAQHVVERNALDSFAMSNMRPMTTGVEGASRRASPALKSALPVLDHGARLHAPAAVRATFSVNLSGASYDPATQTCASVPCHLAQSFDTGLQSFVPLRWGVVPVGYATCSECHLP